MMSSKTQILEKASPSSQSVIFYLLCAGFVFNGVVISFIGPILPVFMAKWGLDDSRAGLFSLVHGAGESVGIALVKHPLVTAVGFTGSLGAGRALCDAAAARPGGPASRAKAATRASTSPMIEIRR